MAVAILIPRVNNNDDTVLLSSLAVAPGATVRVGDILAEVETDKANFSVEAEQAGVVLRIEYQAGATCPIGSTLLWLGDHAGEIIEEKPTAAPVAAGRAKQATAKAMLLISKYGLEAGAVPAATDRLTAAEVEAYIQARGLQVRSNEPSPRTSSVAEQHTLEPGQPQPLTSHHRGMLKTVSWQQSEAASGYLEMPFDVKAWEEYAAEFRTRHSLMMDPLLALMSSKLCRIAANSPKLRATIRNGELYVYNQVNIGFTVQSGQNLLMPVLRDGAALTEEAFVGALGKLQRQAMKNALRPEEASGATVAFTSMARWNVSRHIPILPPHCALIVAHSTALLGATYDHRVLTGFDAAQALKELTKPV